MNKFYTQRPYQSQEHFYFCPDFPPEIRNFHCALKCDTTKGKLESARSWTLSAAQSSNPEAELNIYNM